MMTKNILQRFWNDTEQFLGRMYVSSASKPCNKFLTIKFPTTFKLFQHRVNASSNFADVAFFTIFKMCQHRVNAV